MPEEHEILDDIWTEQAGVSFRCRHGPHQGLIIELTTAGVGSPTHAWVSLTDWRARRLAQVLAKAYMTPSEVAHAD